MNEVPSDEHKQGDGIVTQIPGRSILLAYTCASCGKNTAVIVLPPSTPRLLDCDEPRTCPECDKAKAIAFLRERGCAHPDAELEAMNIDGLMEHVNTCRTLSSPGRAGSPHEP